ncbi:AAA family ATPase [Bacillus carboniphilus]|uniref:AAA family ATPase n=1 Tax=Bacillus carboniphilus TaxID=86663 RepID=A0ABY9JTW3_9BACI|nr:AAA family ATPase [Bacillus carboniphilus]WLR42836.1 AAA family ATPase [Bacillus carboniphilus]
MKIKHIHIYGFGQFEDRKFTFQDQPFQVIYGENEAGKTTIISFIKAVLFGFPSKQTNLQRYIPKKGNKYGGTVKVETQSYETILIERIQGKLVEGDVTLYYEDGQRGGKEELANLIGNMTQSMYDALFGFHLEGVQNVHRLSKKEIGRYLLYASITESDRIWELESQLEKLMDDIYKPYGRKPPLNEKLVELEKLEKERLRIVKEEEKYQFIWLEKNRLKEELDTVKQSIVEKTVEKDRLVKYQESFPLLSEYQLTLTKQKQLPDIEINSKELDIVSSHKEDLGIIEEKLDYFKREQKLLDSQRRNLNLDNKYLNKEEEWNYIANHASSFLDKKQQLNDLIAERKVKEQQLKEQYYSIMGTTDLDETVLSIPTFFNKEKVKKLSTQGEQLSERKKWLDEQFEHASAKLQECEDHMDQIEQQRLSEKELNDLHHNLKELEDQMDTRSIHNQKHQTLISSVLFLLLGTVLIISSILNNQFLYVAIGVCVCLLSVFMLGKKPNKEIGSGKKVITEERLNELREKKHRHHHYTQQLELEKRQQTNVEKELDSIIAQFEKWEESFYNHRTQIENLLEEWNITQPLETEKIVDFYEEIEEVQILYKNVQSLKSQEKPLKDSLQQYQQMYKEISGQQLCEEVDLRKSLSERKEVQEQQKRKEYLLEQLENFTNQTRFYEEKKSELEKKINSRLQGLGSSSIEEFVELAKRSQQRKELTEKLFWLKEQLDLRGLNGQEELKEEDSLNKRITKIGLELNHLQAKMEELQERYSQTMFELKEMEKSETRSDMTMKVQQARAEVKELAKEWATYSTAKELIQQTLNEYRTKKIPELIQTITQFFIQVTSGVYTEVLLPEDQDSFMIKSHDGQLYYAYELSQATAEQLYVATKLALIQSFSQTINLPIVMDDLLVNYDCLRRRKIFRILKMMSEDHQILFFTCHQYDQEVIQLSSLCAEEA